MKQKRTYITLLLVVALLVLGIAYATIQGDELEITGTATSDIASGEVDVEFVSVTPASGEGTTYGEIDSRDPDKATFVVGDLAKAGDSKTVTFTIENKTENAVPVTLGEPSIVCNNAEYYEVSYAYGKTALSAYNATGDDDSTTLAITVKLLKTITTEDSKTSANANNTITITLNATAATN